MGVCLCVGLGMMHTSVVLYVHISEHVCVYICVCLCACPRVCVVVTGYVCLGACPCVSVWVMHACTYVHKYVCSCVYIGEYLGVSAYGVCCLCVASLC